MYKLIIIIIIIIMVITRILKIMTFYKYYFSSPPVGEVRCGQTDRRKNTAKPIGTAILLIVATVLKAGVFLL
jgi:hypothetical protein